MMRYLFARGYTSAAHNGRGRYCKQKWPKPQKAQTQLRNNATRSAQAEHKVQQERGVWSCSNGELAELAMQELGLTREAAMTSTMGQLRMQIKEHREALKQVELDYLLPKPTNYFKQCGLERVVHARVP